MTKIRLTAQACGITFMRWISPRVIAQHCASSKTKRVGTRLIWVLELVTAIETTSQRTAPYVIAARRAGDIAIFYAKADKAKEQLGWQARRTL